MPGFVEGLVVESILNAGVLGSIATTIGTSTTIALLTTIGQTVVLGAASRALIKMPDFSTMEGRTITTRDPIGSHQVVYGRTRLGGNMVYLGTTENNKYLHIVATVAGHEIDAFEGIYANDELLELDANGFTQTGSKYGTKIRVKLSVGDHVSQPFSDLVSETASLTDGKWTSAHILQGSALAYIRLEYSSDHFPAGIPNFSFKIRGKKVYDPRTSTTAWSANPALCLNDYLTSSDYGFGAIYANEIDETALIAAANICDEDVPLAAGGTENRYECNGQFSTGSMPEDIVNNILSSMAGKAIRSQGKWRIISGAYSSPDLTFDESDLRSGITVQTLISRRENFNVIKGVFSSEPDNYILADFPQVKSTTAIALDGWEVERSIELPFTTSASMAQRLAKIELLKARQQITTTLPLKLQGLRANVGDIVQVNNTRLGWSAKKFEVVGLSVSFEDNATGVDLALREISTDVYDWSTSEEQAFDPAPNTNLPNAFSVSPPSNLSTTVIGLVSNDGTYSMSVEATWDVSTDGFVDHYLVKAKPNSFTRWFTSTTKDGSYLFNNVIAGDYDIEIYAINALGVSSSALTGTVSVNSDTTAPSAPTGLTITSNGFKSAYLKWTNPTDYDYFQTVIYASLSNDSSTAVEVSRVSGTSITYSGLPDNTTWFVWLKSVDYTGNQSAFNTSQFAGVQFSTLSNVYTDISNVEGDVTNLQDDVSTAQGDITNLQSSVTTLTASLSNKLEASTSYVLTGVVQPTNTGGVKAGNITWNSTTGALTGGSGVALTENGIIGAQSGVSKFSIDTSGNAVFSGDISTAGDGYFEGKTTTSSAFYTPLGTKYIDYSLYGRATSTASNTNYYRAGLVGLAVTANNTRVLDIGVFGSAPLAHNSFGYGGIGVYGQGGHMGGCFIASDDDDTWGVKSVGLYCSSYGDDTTRQAFTINHGKFTWAGKTWVEPDGSSTKYLRADGSWATPPDTTTNSTINLYGNLGVASATANFNLFGSTSTGIAGAYVGTSGSGNTVTWTVQTTSPSDRRLKENIADCTFGLDFVNALQPKSYQLKADERHQTGFGFIADEVAAIGDVYGTSLVYREENWQVGEEIGFDTIHYPSYIPILVKAIQELSAENSSLKARIEALESK